MFDERAFIARIESAGVDELAQLLTSPTAQEETVLRAHLGDQRYQRMHSIVLRRNLARSATPVEPYGNVVVIHGTMGGELGAIDRAGASLPIWISPLRIMTGWLDRLQLSDDGRDDLNQEYEVRATGILKRYYGELLLSLAQRWKVRAFWYDWRKDLDIAADELQAKISGWFADTDRVHIVAHSMGGLVARTFIKKHPQRWATMLDPDGRSGGRLIMLGTPNYGSFAIPQVMVGMDPLVNMLSLVDLTHKRIELLNILNSFVGSYQMLPSPLVERYADQSIDRLYDPATYKAFDGLQVSQRHLDTARAHHELLRYVDDDDLERMIYIAGFNQLTYDGITQLQKLDTPDGYRMTLDGDGRVSHGLGLPTSASGKSIKTYYIEEIHDLLASNEKIIAALDDLLTTGMTSSLHGDLAAARTRQRGAALSEAELRKQLSDAQSADAVDLQVYVNRMRTRNANPEPITYVSVDERKVADILMRGLAGAPSEGERQASTSKAAAPFAPARIEIRLVWKPIQNIDELTVEGPPIDALSVGHYVGLKPQTAMRELGEAIRKWCIKSMPRAAESGAEDILSQFAERGTIRGDLGQSFFLPDPRTQNGAANHRLIAIAGMGVPGRFGAPELTVLARELCWALGRIGKQHLATVLTGAGKGNLSERDAVNGWIRGIKYAITGAHEDEQWHLRRVTFVEYDPRKVENIQRAILNERARLMEKNRLILDYKPLTTDDLAELRKAAQKWGRREWEQEWERQHSDGSDQERSPTRVTLERVGNTFRFGAITDVASIPERSIPLDPKLVDRANDELAAEWDLGRQLERGQFMERLLVPEDLREALVTDAPLVMLLDSITARLHWEAFAHMDRILSSDGAQSSRGDSRQETAAERSLDYFLGTSRSFTRQLRTAFAPPPEPPPPPRRVLRVLVVADPAEDMHLPGAEEEGIEVADLFDSFNAIYGQHTDNQIEVVRLFGPREATRTNVLRQLILRSYDALHFAGHCTFDRANPLASGWIFSNGERLTANELNRIDRVPKFVFSNACESGITPDRSEMRSVELAPTFAESFFNRGVSNFVCTAWPVDDVAAREFALAVYQGLLGLSRTKDPVSRYCPSQLKPMHIAMRDARRAIASTPSGVRTWGAYQHYGNPYFRFFDSLPVLGDEADQLAAEPVQQGAAMLLTKEVAKP